MFQYVCRTTATSNCWVVELHQREKERRSRPRKQHSLITQRHGRSGQLHGHWSAAHVHARSGQRHALSGAAVGEFELSVQSMNVWIVRPSAGDFSARARVRRPPRTVLSAAQCAPHAPGEPKSAGGFPIRSLINQHPEASKFKKYSTFEKFKERPLYIKNNWMLFLFIYGDVYESRRQEYTRVLLLFARSKRDCLIYR